MPDLQLWIHHKNMLYQPACEGELTLSWQRQGAPGKLGFTILNDGRISFQEGDTVRLSVDGVDVFFGFVFTKRRSKSKGAAISVTAYDQLRYFKNKDFYQYKNKRADELIAMIAGDFQLRTGVLEPTGYAIAHRIEDNQTLFDIVQNALDLTLQATGKMYVLYDDFGKLTLRSMESMRLHALICAKTAQDFDYSSSIDSDTYNQIKLIYENEAAGTREVYMAKDSNHINDWGVLQKFETLKQPESGAARADALLSLYNRKTRSLSVKGAFGDIRARGGSLLPVWLRLGDIQANSYLLAEQVTHHLSADVHTMDLTLRGNVFE